MISIGYEGEACPISVIMLTLGVDSHRQGGDVPRQPDRRGAIYILWS